jgi:hypothetical protein
MTSPSSYVAIPLEKVPTEPTCHMNSSMSLISSCVLSSSQRCLDQHEDTLSNSPCRQWPEGIVRLGSLLRLVKVKESQPMSKKTTDLFHHLHLLCPLLHAWPFHLYPPCATSVDEWRRRKSRGFPIQQEHQGLNRDEQVKDALSWCRDNTNCWGNLRLTM